MSNGGIGELFFGFTYTFVNEKEEDLRATPQFPLFAPVKLFSLRFLNRSKRRVSNGGIVELFFGFTDSSLGSVHANEHGGNWILDGRENRLEVIR